MSPNPIKKGRGKRGILSNSQNPTKKSVQVPVVTMEPDSSTPGPYSQNQPSETKMNCEPSCSSSHADANISNVPTTSKTLRPRLRVLSLFDGIGTGYLALTELGFDVEVYYASEIDRNAKLLTRSHYGNNIQQLGSVTDIDEEMLRKIGPINLLIGGSPCSDLSCVNPRRRGIFNPQGTGILFFEFYRIFDILYKESISQNYAFFWLFENVTNMEIKQKQHISKFLNCEPCTINSLHLSAQQRKRFFWSNLKGIMEQDLDIDEKNVGPLLDHYLNKNLNRVANVDKICTITTKKSCLQDGRSRNPVTQDGEISDLFITEIENIFGFPSHYTDICNLNNTERQKLLGKAWSVQVVKKIFQTLDKDFVLKLK